MKQQNFYNKNSVVSLPPADRGFYFLKKMRCGFTTGSCAAAGAKAALLAHLNNNVNEVEIFSPQGDKITIPIKNSLKTKDGGIATVTKDAGDDPDITHGIDIIVEVNILSNTNKIDIKAGQGIGIVTKPGLSVAVGEPAINPGPQKMIISAILSVLGDKKGCEVIISIPEGEKLAKKTLNSVLGVKGGLSIIGTSGVVRPMSEEAFKNSLSPQISVAKALGYESIVLVPGKIGQDIAIKQYGLPENAVIQTSNFIGHMLEFAVHEEIKNILLFGHLGKLVKVAAGVFHTHNRIADARMETIAAYMGALGAPQKAIKEILNCTTTEAAMPIIEYYQMSDLYNLLAKRVSERASRYVFNDLVVGTVIVTLKGKLLGMDNAAKSIGGTIGWNIK